MAVDCPHCSKSVSGWIPEDRLSEMAKGKREATQRAEAAEAQLPELQATSGRVDTLTASLAEVTAHAESLQKSHTQQLAVYTHGITDAEDVADIMAIYDRRAPKDVGLSEWLGSETLPRSVSALLSKPAAVGTPATASGPVVDAVAGSAAEASPPATGAVPVNGHTVATPAEPTPAAVASANAGAVPTPPARSLPTSQEIATMSVDQYKAHRDQLLASLTRTAPTG
jgi:hypothetical protein